MSKSKDSGYFEVSSLAGAKLFSRNLMGEIVMLNMLRFREVANYSASPALAPERPIAGEEAYRRYSIHTLPLLQAAGGSVVYSGTGGDFLIGPADESWDLVLLVRHQSLQAFRAFATDKDYLAWRWAPDRGAAGFEAAATPRYMLNPGPQHRGLSGYNRSSNPITIRDSKWDRIAKSTTVE